MKMRRLITMKPHKYGTRHLVAGDEYEAPDRHAVALVASRKARFHGPTMKKRELPTVPPAPAAPTPSLEEKPAAEVTAEMQGTGLDLLRTQAERLGIEVDRRWGIARLQHEIRQKKGLRE